MNRAVPSRTAARAAVRRRRQLYPLAWMLLGCLAFWAAVLWALL